VGAAPPDYDDGTAEAAAPADEESGIVITGSDTKSERPTKRKHAKDKCSEGKSSDQSEKDEPRPD
jgi:hypothetical protein